MSRVLMSSENQSPFTAFATDTGSAGNCFVFSTRPSRQALTKLCRGCSIPPYKIVFDFGTNWKDYVAAIRGQPSRRHKRVGEDIHL
ncbi:hypothetical protein OPV22_015917 [Ensete ventricosum]|uniref:Uncharacterized protein n=1 Tax=Ensete ventricosum TaxID=4639 RepID=A0AAV8R9B0_ENSVE|nr:hypothetical protein OPV22_015917 [Ensete ventricosum]